MLKSLIKLFAESFLKSKKSWVGVQVMPSVTETVISATMDATWRTYVAPEDGYVVFKAEHLSSSCMTRFVQVLIMGVSRVSLEDLYRFGRAALCTITSRVRTAPQDSPLLHVSLSDLEKGGASC